MLRARKEKLPPMMFLSYQEEKCFWKVSSSLLSSPESEMGLSYILRPEAASTSGDEGISASAKQNSCSVNKERGNNDF